MRTCSSNISRAKLFLQRWLYFHILFAGCSFYMTLTLKKGCLWMQPRQSMYLLRCQWCNGQHIQLPPQRPQELNGIEWQGTMFNDLHIFSWPGAEPDRFPEKVMGHAMIWSKTQAWIKIQTRSISKKLWPALVFPSQPFCYFTSTATWQNVVPLPERESVELLGFRVFVFSSQQKHGMRLWNAFFFWDASCSSTFWLLKRDTCFLISRHHMLCSSKCG